jgi:methionyl-tRNA synthetase
VHPFEDSPFSLTLLHDAYQAHLVNGVGNLTNRIMKLAEVNLDGPVDVSSVSLDEKIASKVKEFTFHEAMDLLWSRVSELDERIASQQPYKVVKIDKEAGVLMIEKLVQDLHNFSEQLKVFLPSAAGKIQNAITENKKPETPIFPRLEKMEE